MADGWLQVVQDALKIPGLLVEIYGDLARPGVRQVGKALETVVGLGNTVLWPIAWANERSRLALEKNLERYRRALENVPEEKIVNVAPEIGVPIAEKLGYVRDERLSDLYVRLLATASNTDTLDKAHPSFVNVINNLSPDEAHLLEYFKNEDALPFVQAKAVAPSTGWQISLQDLILQDHVTAALAYPQNADAYLSNLSGLGLLNVKHDEWLPESPVYAQLEAQHRPRFADPIQREPKLQGQELQFDKGIVRRTSFGWKFIQACHAK
jgi:Abortive infection alpha